MKRESHAMLAHQTKQVTFLLPKIGTQNETLDSDIKEGCQVASHSGCGHSFVIWFIKCCKNLVRRVSSLISFGVNSTSCVWFWQSVSQCIVDFRTFIADNYCVVFHLLAFTLLSIAQYFILLNIAQYFTLLCITQYFTLLCITQYFILLNIS